MNKLLEDYAPNMGYFPTYGCPEKLGEDEEFAYYKFKVPRHYIRGVLEEGNAWPDYEECMEEGTLDDSVVLGMRFLPVYTGVEYLDADVDFVYYKVRVPKVLLETPISGGSMCYRIAYEYIEDFEKEEEEEERSKIPKAGEGMPGRHEEQIVKKVKERTVHLYEVTLRCNNSDCLADDYNEVTSNIFDVVYNVACPECLGTLFSLIGCKVLVEEEGE